MLEPDGDRRVLEARATRNWVGADGIVRSVIRPGTDFTLEDSEAALAATRALVATLPTPVLVDCRGVQSASRESRLFWQRPDVQGSLSAMAILVGSPVSRAIASFFLHLVRPDFKIRVFSSEAEAAAWLLGRDT